MILGKKGNNEFGNFCIRRWKVLKDAMKKVKLVEEVVIEFWFKKNQ